MFFKFVSSGAGYLNVLRITHADGGKLFNVAANPAEAAFFIRVRIVNPRHLLRIGKEILLDKEVVLGEKNTEAGMRVVPPDNLVVRVFLILDLIYMFPGLL